jgi:hypothetical protein
MMLDWKRTRRRCRVRLRGGRTRTITVSAALMYTLGERRVRTLAQAWYAVVQGGAA